MATTLRQIPVRRRRQRPAATHDDQARDPLTAAESGVTRILSEVWGWA